jgi:putative ABC transport system substrate-binding protein
MRRREFIALLGGAAAWPLAAHAQAGKLPIIRYLGASAPSAASQLLAAFVGRLRELGWVDGRNVTIEYRWLAMRASRFIFAGQKRESEFERGPSAPGTPLASRLRVLSNARVPLRFYSQRKLVIRKCPQRE